MPTAQNPLGPPVISGTTITVDLALQSPTRITKFLSDITLQRFLAERVFNSDGGVSGGAVVYDQLDTNQLYPTRMPEPIAPGAEYPSIQDARLIPKVATVAKWGAKFFITDEARDRNDVSLFTNSLRRLGNGMIKTIDQVAIAVMEAEFTARPAQVSAGHSWSAVTPIGATPTAVRSWPHADLQAAIQQAAVDELGYVYNLVLLNPLDASQLAYIYGATNVDAVLADFGLSKFVSNRVTAGVCYIVAEKQAGGIRIESPLGSRTYREEETDRTWVQSSVRPVMYIDEPLAMRKVTGIA